MSEHDQRRRYWREQMEAARDFMERAARHSIEESGEPLEPLEPAAAAAGARMSFSSRPHARGLPRRFFLRASLVGPFVAAALELNERGVVLHVEDAYRSPEMQTALASDPAVVRRIVERTTWEQGGTPPSPELVLRRLSALVATSPKVGTHVSGSAIDISLFDLEGRELWRGAPYLEMSELTPMASPYVSAEAHKARALATSVLARQGFHAYPYEFWHYSQRDAFAAVLTGGVDPVPYGPVSLDGASGAVEPVLPADRPLVTTTALLDVMAGLAG